MLLINGRWEVSDGGTCLRRNMLGEGVDNNNKKNDHPIENNYKDYDDGDDDEGAPSAWPRAEADI